jgi:hypothetical protein
MGGGARQLYYYPKDTVQVTNIGEAVNKSLMEQAGVQAAVPTVGRKQPVWDLSFAADASVGACDGHSAEGVFGTARDQRNAAGWGIAIWAQPQSASKAADSLSELLPLNTNQLNQPTNCSSPQLQMDAVVSLQSLAPLPPDKRRTLFAEAARVLRPGGAFVFIERVAASERAAASPLRALITAGSADGGLTITLPEIDALGKGPAGAGALWQGVQYDLALEGQDPHALGVAVRGQGRAPGVGGSGGPGAAEAAGERAEKRERRGKPTGAKGF